MTLRGKQARSWEMKLQVQVTAIEDRGGDVMRGTNKGPG